MNQDIPPNKDEILVKAAKKGGKELVQGFSKAGLMFTKRMAEGAFNAQMAQSEKQETMDKLRVAGNELGKAILKGAIEGANESMAGLIKGVSKFNAEMAKYQTDNLESDDKDDDLLDN